MSSSEQSKITLRRDVKDLTITIPRPPTRLPTIRSVPSNEVPPFRPDHVGRSIANLPKGPSTPRSQAKTNLSQATTLIGTGSIGLDEAINLTTDDSMSLYAMVIVSGWRDFLTDVYRGFEEGGDAISLVVEVGAPEYEELLSSLHRELEQPPVHDHRQAVFDELKQRVLRERPHSWP